MSIEDFQLPAFDEECNVTEKENYIFETKSQEINNSNDEIEKYINFYENYQSLRW